MPLPKPVEISEEAKSAGRGWLKHQSSAESLFEVIQQFANSATEKLTDSFNQALLASKEQNEKLTAENERLREEIARYDPRGNIIYEE